MTRTIIGLSGNLDRPSKTRALIRTVVATAASQFEATGEIYDLADFGRSLGSARHRCFRNSHRRSRLGRRVRCATSSASPPDSSASAPASTASSHRPSPTAARAPA